MAPASTPEAAGHPAAAAKLRVAALLGSSHTQADRSERRYLQSQTGSKSAHIRQSVVVLHHRYPILIDSWPMITLRLVAIYRMAATVSLFVRPEIV